MLRSLYSGVSGLKAHQVRMDIIGNNVANVNTFGYKKSRVTFLDLFSQTLRNASRPSDEQGGINPTQVGLGVTIGSTNTIFSPGSIQPTERDTDMAISGDGFYTLKDSQGEFVFSRLGAFEFDATGTLVNQTGLRVQGYTVDDQTGTLTQTIGDIIIPGDSGLEPEATNDITYVNNLDANAAIGTSTTVAKEVYDSQGQGHMISLTYTKVADNDWQYSVSLAEDDPLIQDYISEYFPDFASLSQDAQEFAVEAAQANVFEPEATTAYMGKARTTLEVPATKASTSIMGGDMIITAKEGGIDGNNISVEFLEAAENDTPTTVEVVGDKITVTIGKTGAALKSYQEVVDSINFSPASSLIGAKVASTATPTDPASAEPSVTLNGGVESAPITISAANSGLGGNDYSIVLDDGNGAANQVLGATINANDKVTVTLATDANGQVTSTLQEVVDMINSMGSVNAAATEDDLGSVGTAANGDITFSSIPEEGSTITIADTTIAFFDSSAGNYADAAAAATALGTDEAVDINGLADGDAVASAIESDITIAGYTLTAVGSGGQLDVDAVSVGAFAGSVFLSADDAQDVVAEVNSAYKDYLAGAVAETQFVGGFLEGLDITADFMGVAGNEISIKMQNLSTATETTATADGTDITVNLAPGATLGDVIDALNGNSESAMLVDAALAAGADKDALASTAVATNMIGGSAAATNPRTGSILFDVNGKIDEEATRKANLAGTGKLTKSFSFDPVGSDADRVTVSPNFEGLTQFEGAFSVVARDQDGNPASTISNINVEKDGTIIGEFAGGYRKVLGQITLATFANKGGLNKIGNSLYRATGNSGDPQIDSPETVGRGTIVSNALEMSNVDLAEEFTDMVITQRGFQANSRTISTSDDILQELVNLKR